MKKVLQSLFFLVPFCVLGFLPVILQGIAFERSDAPKFVGFAYYLKMMFSDSDIMSLIMRQFVGPTVIALIASAVVAAVFFVCFRKGKIAGVKTVALCLSVFAVAVVAASVFRYLQILHYGTLPVYSSWTIAAIRELLRYALYSGNLTIILQIGIVASFLSWVVNIVVDKSKQKRVSV